MALMRDRSAHISGLKTLAGSCASIFWPGVLVFGFPGVMGQHWQKALDVGQAEVGQTLFFVLAGVGLFMFLAARLQKTVGPAWLTAAGGVLCGTATIMVGYALSMNLVSLWAFLVGAGSALT